MQLVESAMSIGAVAARTGFTVAAIRYYEDMGLIAPAARRAGGHRAYGRDAVDALAQVRALRELGLSIGQIRVLRHAQPGPHALGAASAAARAKLAGVRSEIETLRLFAAKLSDLVGKCSASCIGGPASDCSIVKDIAVARPAPARGCCGSVAVKQRSAVRPRPARCG